jgi:hypothetical protein
MLRTPPCSVVPQDEAWQLEPRQPQPQSPHAAARPAAARAAAISARVKAKAASSLSSMGALRGSGASHSSSSSTGGDRATEKQPAGVGGPPPPPAALDSSAVCQPLQHVLVGYHAAACARLYCAVRVVVCALAER